MDLIADTPCLVGLWRRQSWATGYAAANPAKSMAIPWIVLGEFWHGALRAKHDPAEVNQFLSMGIHITDAGPIFPVYAKICAEMSNSSAYQLIGQNDLWIASVEVAVRKPLLSRNRRHFESISELELLALCE